MKDPQEDLGKVSENDVVADTQSTGTSVEDRKSSFNRRALLHAGWAVPVIMTVAPPRAFAQSPGPHTDFVEHTNSTVQFTPDALQGT